MAERSEVGGIVKLTRCIFRLPYLPMTYPIFQNQIPVGTLFEQSEGLYTLFTARLPARSGLWRLWLSGEGSAPLGLMEPGEDCLSLRRRLSRAELSKLPPFSKALLLPADEKPPESPELEKQPLEAKKQIPPPEAPPAKEKPSVVLWRSLSDGCLYRREGAGYLLALPCERSLKHPALRYLELEGKKYIVFRY